MAARAVLRGCQRAAQLDLTGALVTLSKMLLCVAKWANASSDRSLHRPIHTLKRENVVSFRRPARVGLMLIYEFHPYIITQPHRTLNYVTCH